MASEFPGRPRLTKGALLVYDSQDAGATPSQRIMFSYNPEQLRRSFSARAPQQQPQRTAAAREDVLRVPGPPVETITMTIVLDAADALAEPEAHQEVVRNGLNPVLATLELLLYPASARVAEIERQAQQGAVQVAPARVPLVMLAWGDARVVPVQLQSFSVTEEHFDPKLNPIQAKVDLGLRVLTYMEFPRASAGREAYIGYQKKKEQLAQLAGGGAA
jgi:hypothetical protein